MNTLPQFIVDLIKSPKICLDLKYKDTLLPIKHGEDHDLIAASSLILGKSSYFHNMFQHRSSTQSTSEDAISVPVKISVAKAVIDSMHGISNENQIAPGYDRPGWLYRLDFIRCTNFFCLDTRHLTENLDVPVEGIPELIDLALILEKSDPTAMDYLRKMLPDDFLHNTIDKYPWITDEIIDRIFPEVHCCQTLPSNVDAGEIQKRIHYRNRTVIVGNSSLRSHVVVNPYSRKQIYRVVSYQDYLITPSVIIHINNDMLYAFDVTSTMEYRPYSIKQYITEECKIKSGKLLSLTTFSFTIDDMPYVWNFMTHCVTTIDENGNPMMSVYQQPSGIIYHTATTLFFIQNDHRKAFTIGPDDRLANIDAIVHSPSYNCTICKSDRTIHIILDGEITNTMTLDSSDNDEYKAIGMDICDEKLVVDYYNATTRHYLRSTHAILSN